MAMIGSKFLSMCDFCRQEILWLQPRIMLPDTDGLRLMHRTCFQKFRFNRERVWDSDELILLGRIGLFIGRTVHG